MKYTIIITVYNKEKYLKKCIDSVCTQTFNKYEVIIVNDGSTDNSDKIIKECKYKYKFKYYSKKNTGVSDTRNYAIKKVRTKYFMFVDADDYLDKNILKEIDKYDNYDLLSFNAIMLDKDYNFIENMHRPKFEGLGEDLLVKFLDEKCNFGVPWGYVYETEWFKKNKFEYPYGMILEDYYLTPFIIMDSKKTISLDYVGYYYVEDTNSIMNNKKNVPKIMESLLVHSNAMMKRVDEGNYKEFTKKTLKSYIAGSLMNSVDKVSGKERKEFIKKLKQMHICKYLVKPLWLKVTIVILYKINLYYPVRKFLKWGKYAREK